MSLSFAFILVPTICYAGACAYYLFTGNHPLAIVYSGYSWANVGLLWLDLLLKK
jgi:hypothetical protein